MLRGSKEALLRACQNVVGQVDLSAAEQSRRRFLDRYGPERLETLPESDVLALAHGAGKDKGLYWHLEYDAALNPFGSGSGGYSPRWRVWRSREGEWMRTSGNTGVPCSEDEAWKATLSVLRALYAGALGVEYFHLAAGDPKTWESFQKAISEGTLGEALGWSEPVDTTVLDLGWAHKYLALVDPGTISLTHTPLYMAHHLIRLTGEAPPPQRYLLDYRWLRLIRDDLELERIHPVLLMNGVYEAFGYATGYYRVGTDEGGAIDRWPAMRDGGFISIGWGELGDLSALLADRDWNGAKKLLVERLTPSAPTASVASRWAGEILRFRREMGSNARVVAMKGKTLLGIGLVEGGYEFVPEDDLQPHHRKVRWLEKTTETWDQTPSLRRTVYGFGHKYEQAAFIERRVAQARDSSEPISSGTTAMPFALTSLNIILYGPPGTGKTYATIKRAVRTILGQAPEDRGELKEQYDSLVRAGRIGFLTFHQSYAYEDFVEGIRPVLSRGEKQTTPRYECASGVLKQMAVRALYDLLEPIPAEPGKPAAIPFDRLWQELLNKVRENPAAEEYQGLEFIVDAGTEKTLYARNKKQRIRGSRWAQNCGRERMERVFSKLRDQDHITRSEAKAVLGVEAHYPLFVVVFDLLKLIEKTLQSSPPVSDLPAASVTEEDRPDIVQRFLLRGEGSGYRIRFPEQWPHYVLIIDEINRGNISKILGELITLLEEDKRLPGENSLIVTLPYSRDLFALPANLHILGTMNTADKSIALVDIALRRRFEFEELAPDFSVCEGLNEEMRRVLETLNRRITLRKDRDHRIGHAFFMGVSDEAGFNRMFERKILPLLAEYFYNDSDGLRYVLGEAGANDDGGFLRRIPGADGAEARTRWQWYSDTANDPPLSPLETLVANYAAARP